MKLFYSIILALFLVQSLQGQELYGKYLGQEQGLLSDECYDINFDENGYLIVGTEYGPMKYNGEKFMPICTNLPMERRVIYDFEKDRQGNTYLVNSKNELFQLKNDKAVRIRIRNASEFHIRNLNFFKLYAADDGLYISAQREYLKFSFRTKKIHRLYTYKNAPFTFIYHSKKKFPFIKYAEDDVPTSYVRFIFPESNQQFRFEKTMVFDSREHCLKVGKTDYILMSMRLFKKTGNTYIPLNFSRILFMEFFHNRIWLCTYDGLMELDLKGNLIQHHFKGEVIGGVAPLKSGGIAVSLNRKGVFVSANINNRIYTNFTPTATRRFHGINLTGCLDGRLLSYADNQFKSLVNPPPKIVSRATKKMHSSQIVEITPAGNSLLITYNEGLIRFSSGLQKVKDFRNFAYSIFGQFSYKEYIYFIERNVVIKNNWNGLNMTPFPHDYKNIPIKDIQCHARLNDSTIMLGTKTGLVELDLKTDRFSRPDLFKKELSISGIQMIGAEKTLVFTRFDGIYLISQNKIIRKINAPCISISSGMLYNKLLVVRGNDGIYIKPIVPSSKHGWSRFFQGKANNTFILDNSLLIAFKNDLIIKKLSDYQLIYKPKVRLNHCLLGDQKMNGLPVSIAANTPISIDMDILQFDASKKGLYYLLNGANPISQQIEGTKINFDALKSGSYVLKIHPVIDGKIQFNNSKTFRFTIEKTFWESTVFYILSGILILSIVVTSILIIHLRRRKRKAERSELESRLNEYKLLAVKAQVNPHFLSNGLAAIQALILKEDNDLAAQYLAKFSFLMRKTLYYSEKQFITAKQELELVDAYLELELLRFRNRFVIRREIKLSKSQLKKFQFPSLLLQPILENAIWHGLKFQENNPELHILLEINQNNELLVGISDNGPGFNESTKSEEHLSKGNQLITDRIDALNVQFQKNVASIEVITSNSGTTITFIFHPEVYQPTEQ